MRDDEARSLAIDPGHSCIVQAPAGSGKTGLLIQRYLRLLSLVEYPEEIIAITFTRKAVAEMQGRVMQALADAARGCTANNAHEQQTLQLAREVLRRDRARDWRIMDTPVRLRVQTIDSLCAWLSRQMPVLSGLGAPPEIINDAEALYRQAALRVLSDVRDQDQQAVGLLLQHLDNDQGRVVRLLSDMLTRRNQWLRHAVRRHDRDTLEKSLQGQIVQTLSALVAAFPEEQAEALCRCLRYARETLRKIKPDHALCALDECTSLPGATVQDLPCWRAIHALLLTSAQNWRKRLSKNEGFPAVKDGGDQEMKEVMGELLAAFADNDELLERLRLVRHLPEPRYRDAEWQMVQALCRCLVLAEAQLRTVLAEHNRIDYIGMEQAATQALGEEGQPSNLGLYLDYRIRHILVDEFQDISLNQQQLLRQLCAGWSARDGHSLFLVGDPMQSIYGFREAELGVFLDTFNRKRLGQVPLRPLRLSANFRSRAGIVDWINDCFQQILPATDDVASGAARHVPCEAIHQQGGLVQIHPFFKDQEQRFSGPIISVGHGGEKHTEGEQHTGGEGQTEARRVQQLVEDIASTRPEDSMAILVRSRLQLRDIISQLRQCGQSFRAVDIEGLVEHPAIQDALALTRAWLHPADRIAWLAVLRAPWCGLSLAELHEVSQQAGQGAIWQALQSSRALASGSDEQSPEADSKTDPALQRLCSAFREAMDQRHQLSLREVVEGLWLRLGGPATLHNSHDLDNVDRFFDLVEEFDVGGCIEQPARFNERLLALFAEEQTNAQLQVMTIHKAKGLEFDHVILPGLGAAPRVDDKEILLHLPCQGQAGESSLLLAPIAPVGAEDSPVYGYVRHLRARRQELEEQRLLYVASTRARRCLHLLATADVKQPAGQGNPVSARARSLLHHLWPVLGEGFVNALKSPEQKPQPPARVGAEGHGSLWRLAPDWQLPPAPAGLPRRVQKTGGLGEQGGEQGAAQVEYRWAGATIRHVGTVVHRMLQHHRDIGDALATIEADRIDSLLIEAGVHRAELAPARQRVLDALESMAEDARGRWLLDPQHREQHSEYAVSGTVDGVLHNVVIDRSFVDTEGVRWVVDYKTSHHGGGDMQAFLDREQARYQPQMRRYAMLMQALTGMPVRAALYFPLLQGWREYPPEFVSEEHANGAARHSDD